MPGWIDHLIVALILVVAPIDGAFERRRLQREIAAGKPNARLDGYARLMRWQWGSGAVLLAFWILSGRSLATLGFQAPNGVRFLLSAMVAVAITMFLARQVRTARASDDFAAQVWKAAASLSFLMPSTEPESRRFTFLGIGAGIVEEILCRGFLIWYFASFFPMWAAVVLSSAMFGLGHAYQGPGGIFKTGVAGLFFGLLFWYSGSLWIPMFIHAAVDVLQGRLIYVSLSKSAGGPARDYQPESPAGQYQ